MCLQLLHPHRYATLLRVYLENLRIDLLANSEHIGSPGDTAPRDIADVQQRICTANVDERTIVGKAPYRAAYQVALLEFGIATVFGCLLFFFSNHSPIHHDVFIGFIELDDSAADLLFNQLLHLGCVPGAAAGSRHERTDTHVHAQPALYDSGHRPHDCGLTLVGPLQSRPIRWPRSFAQSQFVIAFRIASANRDLQLLSGTYSFAFGLEL